MLNQLNLAVIRSRNELIWSDSYSVRPKKSITKISSFTINAKTSDRNPEMVYLVGTPPRWPNCCSGD